MLTSPTHLRDELVQLDNDLSGLPGRRVALLGFRDPNPKRIGDNLLVLGQTAGWTLVDARDAPGAPLAQVLGRALESPRPALLLDAAVAVPTDAALLIRAMHDSQDIVRWVGGAPSSLPPRRVLYVVASGARSVEDLPALLQRIDFKKFVRPPA